MPNGLEQVVERFIRAISYSGVNGLSIDDFVQSVQRYVEGGQKESLKQPIQCVSEVNVGVAHGPQPSPTPKALVFARKAWGWLIARPEVVVGSRKENNQVSLDDLLALPDQVPEQDSDETHPAEPAARIRKKVKTSNAEQNLVQRPRLFVTEQTVWKAVTGHGIDYKRIPPMEWKLLLVIASSQENGILQGDLCRRSGQDKRSVPKRTDALAQKGYIAKRTAMTRGCKTSKIWLLCFAPPLLPGIQEASEASLFRASGIDMSQEALTKDLNPVKWSKRWKGEVIDFASFGQTFLSIVKAWGVIRYSDLRSKMGIESKQWQMKILARCVRSFARRGVIQYTAAQVRGQRKVYKECLRFLREPTNEEWEAFLATGKRASKYSDGSQDRMPKPDALSLRKKRSTPGKTEKAARATGKKRASKSIPQTVLTWTPDMPLANMVFEIVRRAGPEGVSNPQLSAATIGYGLRRYMYTKVSNMATTDSQPSHLRKFQVKRELVRSGKTTSYMYSAPGASATTSSCLDVNDASTQSSDQGHASHSSSFSTRFGFAEPAPGSFAKSSDITLSNLSQLSRKQLSRHSKTRKASAMEVATTQGRSPKRLREQPDVMSSEVTAAAASEPQPSLPGQNDAVMSQADRVRKEEKADEATQERLPGVYRGVQGSLTPSGPKRGRPKKSLVITFKFEKLKTLKRSDQQPMQTSSTSTTTNVASLGRVIQQKNGQQIEDHSASHTSPETGQGKTAEAAPPSQGMLTLTLSNIRYDGKLGELLLRPKERAVNFVEFDKEPLEILLDDIRGHPSLHDVPGTQDQEMVFVTANGDPNGPQSTYTFLLNAGAQNEAANFRNAVINQTVSNTSVTRAVAPSRGVPSARGRGRGRGGAGGRGAGRVQASTSANSRPWRCEKCGETWKNSLGLKYHRTRSQTVCNPDYNPEGAARKRRRMSITPFHSDNEPNKRPRLSRTTPPRTSGQRRGPKTQGNRWVSLRVSAKPPIIFRGFAFDPAKELVQIDPVSAATVPESFREGEKELPAHSESSRVPETQHAYGLVEPKAGSGGGTGEEHFQPSGLQSALRGLGDAAEAFREEVSGEAVSQTRPKKGANKAAVGRGRRESHPPTSRHLDTTGPDTSTRPSGMATSHTREIDPSLDRRPSGTPSGEASKDVSGGRVRTNGDADDSKAVPPFKMPDRITATSESALRSAQTREIVKYLIDQNGGVFAAGIHPQEGKYLWIAVLGVFLKTFGSGEPPTLSRVHGAVRKLLKQKEIKESFHGFEDSKGLFVTCKLVLRPSVDPHGTASTLLRNKVKEAYPGIYLPAAFSPTKEELKALHGQEVELTNTAHRTGSRRQLPTKIEVLDAPFYTQNPEDGALGIQSLTRTPRKRKADAPPVFGGSLINRTKRSISILEALSGGMFPNQSRKNFASSSPRKLSLTSDGSPLKKRKTNMDPNDTTTPHRVRFLEPNTHLDETRLSDDEDALFSEEPAPVDDSMDPISPKEILERCLPSSAEEMAGRGFSKPRNEFASNVYFKTFLDLVDRCCNWEHSKFAQRLLELDSTIAPDYRFINFSPLEAVSNMKPVTPLWEPQEEPWRSVSPSDPSSDVSEDEENDLQWSVTKPTRGRGARGGSRTARGGARGSGRGRGGARGLVPVASTIPGGSSVRTGRRGRPTAGLRLLPIKTERELSGYPQVPSDYFRKKGDKTADLDWGHENTRIAAFVCVGTLLGGVGKTIDWGLMGRLFPEMKVSALRKFWGGAKKSREPFIDDLTVKFQSEYVRAYENNEVPTLDYDDVLAYDWPFMVKWTLGLTERSPRIVLPETREAFEQQIVISRWPYEDVNWRDNYFKHARSVFNRYQDATSVSAAYPVDRVTPPTIDIQAVAQSWIRCVCSTPRDKYLAEDIYNKLGSLVERTTEDVNEIYKKATNILQEKRSIAVSKVPKRATGRRWRLNDRHIKALERFGHTDKYSDAAAFKAKLDAAFRRGEEVAIPYADCPDGAVVAMLNLQARSRVRFQTTGQRHIPFGFEPLNYETRMFPKKYHHFAMHIAPTDAYLYDDDPRLAALAARAAAVDLPGENPHGLLPIWCDVFGNVDRAIWGRYLQAVVFMIAGRGATTAAELANSLKPAVEPFEVKMILDWGLKAGVLEEPIPGMMLAPSVTEWWWWVVAGLVAQYGAGEAPGAGGDGAQGLGGGGRIVMNVEVGVEDDGRGGEPMDVDDVAFRG